MRIVFTFASLGLASACGGAPEAPMTPLRAGEIRECVGEIGESFASGSDAERVCACATPVDYFQRRRVQQCAEEAGIELRRGSRSSR